jgi:thioesterase domain-containing protein
LGWGKLAAGGVAIKIIPGNHATMMRQSNLAVLREQLRVALDQAQQG